MAGPTSAPAVPVIGSLPRAALAGLLPLVVAAALWWNVGARGELARLALADVVYHVHRTCRTMADFPAVSSYDSYSHHGTPYHLHWPPYLTLLYAAVARAAGAPAELDPVAAVLAPVPMVVGAAAVLLAFACARRIDSATGPALLAAVLVAFSADSLLLFARGALDHHAVTAVVVLGLVWSRLRGSLAGWCVALVVAFTTTPEAPVYVTVLLFVVFAAERLGADVVASHRRTAAWLLAPAAASVVTVVANRLPDPHPPPVLALDLFRLSPFQVLWFAAIGVTAAALLPRSREAGASRVRALATTAGSLLAMAVAAAAIVVVTGQLSPVGARLGGGRLHVTEEQSLFSSGLDAWQPWVRVLLLALAIHLSVLARTARQGGSARRLFGLLALAAATALGLVEYRHLRVLSPLISVAVASATFTALRGLARWPRFDRPGTRAAAVAVAALVLAPPFVSHAWETRRLAGAPSRWDPIAAELIDWLRAHTPPAGPRDRPADYGVFAPWALGHHINALGGRPVVVDPFNHTGVERPLAAVTGATTTAELMAALAGVRARYLVLVDGQEMVIRNVGEPGRFAHGVASRPGWLAYAAEMRRFALFRLFLSVGADPEFGPLRLRLTGSAAAPVLTLDRAGEPTVHQVPRLQVYELVTASQEPGVYSDARP